MLTIADLLSIRHPEPPRWSLDSGWLAFHYDVDGLRELWSVPVTGGGALRASAAGEKAGPFDWAPDGRLTYACKGGVYTVCPGSPGSPDLLLDGPEPVTALKWSPDGLTLAVVRAGVLSLLGAVRPHAGPLLRDLTMPGKVTDFHWSPDSARIGCLTLSGNQRDAAAVEAGTGRLLWRSDNTDWEHGLAWAGCDRLSLARMTMDSTLREFLLVDVTSGVETLVERESSHKGLKAEVAPVPSPQGDAVAYTLLVDGWPHVVLYEVATGERRLLLPGAHEDVGHAFDRPAFSPDGRYLTFASNRGNLQQRQIWRFDRQTGEMRKLTASEGTNVTPAWGPDGGQIAYIACSPWQSAEVGMCQ